MSVAARAVLAIALAGCITQDLEFVPPTNFPPSIETPVGAAYPLDEVIRLRADGLTGGDAGPLTTLSLEVEVRDPDIDQELQYKVYVDYQRGVNEGVADTNLIAPASLGASDRRRRTLPIRLSTTGILRTPGCHRIELLVAERFRSPGPETTGREPVVEGDLGAAVWWVATQASEGEAVDMTGCP